MAEKPLLVITVPNADTVIRQLGGINEQVVRNMGAAMRDASSDLFQEENKRVPVRTGTLRRSWSMKPPTPVSGAGGTVGFEGGIGTNLVYAPIVEFGFNGIVRAHTRTVAFGRKVAPFTVPAHHRTQRPRPYALPALAAATPTIRQRHADAMAAAAEGKDY